MVGYGGIGGLPQTRDLFTAPGSLLGADPYFQDIQRFQDGGLYDAKPGALPDYASLQTPDPYGAQKTANVDVPGLGKVDLGALPNMLPSPIGFATGADSNKTRQGIMPPDAYAPPGFVDSIMAALPGWLSGGTEDASKLHAWGLGPAPGGDAGAALSSQQMADIMATPFGRGNDKRYAPVVHAGGVTWQGKTYTHGQYDQILDERQRLRQLAGLNPTRRNIPEKNLAMPQYKPGWQRDFSQPIGPGNRDPDDPDWPGIELDMIGAWATLDRDKGLDWDPTGPPDDPGGYDAEGADPSGAEGFGSMGAGEGLGY